jgi:hypothetical protein
MRRSTTTSPACCSSEAEVQLTMAELSATRNSPIRNIPPKSARIMEMDVHRGAVGLLSATSKGFHGTAGNGKICQWASLKVSYWGKAALGAGNYQAEVH